MKTALQEAFSELESLHPSLFDIYTQQGREFVNHFHKFLEMEKEQHGKTWDTALDKYEVRAGNYMRAYEDFDEYYNETFKSE
jgi:hypothetical protein